jgi:hypothetical protein
MSEYNLEQPGTLQAPVFFDSWAKAEQAIPEILRRGNTFIVYEMQLGGGPSRRVTGGTWNPEIGLGLLDRSL